MDDNFCQCEATDRPDCRAWLTGTSNVNPRHVCPIVMAWTAQQFIAHRARGTTDMLSSWPVPLGAAAIEQWHEQQREQADESRREWEAWQERGGWQRALADSLAKTGWPGYWEPTVFTAKELPTWFTPLVVKPDAWLGLAGRRTTDAGTAWLLGLAEPTSDDLLSWRWTEPVVLIEAYAHTAADLNALTAAVRPLLDWYRAGLLGKTVTTVGRRSDKEQQASEFLARYEPAYCRLWRDLERPPQDTELAAEMGYSEATFYRRLALLREQNIDLPQPTGPAPPDPEP